MTGVQTCALPIPNASYHNNTPLSLSHTKPTTKMPRQRSGARPTAPARRPAAPTQQQTRPATTYAPAAQAPHAPTAAPAAPSQGGGMFAQMATTAAGVAVGSAIGHTLSSAVGGMFGGSSAEAPVAAAQSADSSATNNNTWGNNCGAATQSFTKCMDENSGNMQICGWYLEQLKACQAAASQY